MGDEGPCRATFLENYCSIYEYPFHWANVSRVWAELKKRAKPAYRYAVLSGVIRSFGDRRTDALFNDERVREFEGFARRAKRKLEALNAASRLEDLVVPPSNRLERLRGELKEFHSVRINDQWRVIFIWIEGEAREVRIVDYH